jgi:ribonuclease HI
MLLARFDGGCWPNPGGHASCACLIERTTGIGIYYTDDAEEVYRKSRYLGYGDHNTNNVAEYEGLKLILEYLITHHEPCLIIGDSRIVINRMIHRNGPGGGRCAPVAQECLNLVRRLDGLTFKWQKRTRNEECDAMCTLEIDDAKSAEWHSQFRRA